MQRKGTRKITIMTTIKLIREIDRERENETRTETETEKEEEEDNEKAQGGEKEKR